MEPQPFPDGPQAPSQASPTPSRSGRRLLLLGAAVVLALGGTAAAAVMLAGGTAAVEMALPADADLAVIASLDPPAGQKLNLFRLAARFPGLREQGDLGEKARDALDEILGDTDLAIDDLQWIGPEVALVAEVHSPAPGDPELPADPVDVALVLATRDESAAEDTLRTAREAHGQRGWSSREHEGVTLWVGQDTAYAVSGGFAIIADEGPAVTGVLDVLAGRAPALGSSDAFTDVVGQLPAGRLGIAFVNVAGAFEKFADQIPASRSMSDRLPGQLQDIESIRGVGISMSAEPDGLAFDVAVAYDPDAMSDELRERLSSAAEPNELLGSVPADAYLVVGQKDYTAGLEQTLEQIVGSDPRAAEELQRLEISGRGGLLDALSGDIALEVGPGDPVAGSVLLAIDDEAAVRESLDRLITLAGRSMHQQPVRRQVRGVTITTIGPQGAFQLTYAVSDGRLIAASSQERLLRVLETTATSGSILDEPAYQRITTRVPVEDAVMVLDVRAIVEAIVRALPPNAAEELERQSSRYLDPISGIAAGARSGPFSQHGRLFVHIPSKE